MREKILVIEDDRECVDLVKETLRKDFRVIFAYDGEEGLEKVKTEGPELVILDLALSGLSGWDVLDILRQHTPPPVVVLTGRYTETKDGIRALTSGADDYLTKPFDPEMLLARVKAILRRVSYKPPPEEFLKVGEISLNPSTHIVRIKKKVIDLTHKEFDLLHLFLLKKGRVLSREFLSDAVWEKDFFGGRTIDKHIANLRKKLGKQGKYIQTIESVGYKLITEE